MIFSKEPTLGQDILLMVAPNGARRTQRDHPQLPMRSAEIARAAAECREAGASAIHVHVRDDDGRHILDAARYQDAIVAIREQAGTDMLIQITTEAVGQYQPQEQIALVKELRPDAVSMALREIMPKAEAASSETKRQAVECFTWMHDNEVLPQIILYDEQDLADFIALFQSGDYPFQTPSVLFVLGRYHKDQRSTPDDLSPFMKILQDHPDFSAHWMVCAFGMQENLCLAEAFKRGGHARVGFENNLFLPSGEAAKNNAELVALAKQSLEQSGRSLLRPTQIAALRTFLLR